jgi:hypothetical protein
MSAYLFGFQRPVRHTGVRAILKLLFSFVGLKSRTDDEIFCRYFLSTPPYRALSKRVRLSERN